MRGPFLVVALLLAAAPASADVPEAEQAWARGERALAGKLVREWLREHPEGARSVRVAALLARTEEEPAGAIGRWEEVLALDPDGPLGAEARWAKGIHAYSAGLYVAAVREFTDLASSEHFDEGRAWLWRGYAELGADNPEPAFESFQEAERRASDPEDRLSAEFGLANASFRSGNVREALRRYDRFERSHRDDGRASAAARRGVECLRLLGRESEASSRAVRIEREYPDSFEATLARAEIRVAERSEAEPEPPRGVAPTPSGPFIVQVASMTDPRNAAGLRRQILAMGIDEIRIEPGEGPEGPVHRVLLGPYDTEEQARAIADSVATLGVLNPRVREASSSR